MSQSIVFSFYKNNELIGYRQDTVGTIGKDFAKIYHYSKTQIDTVLHNIQHNVKNSKGFGALLGIDVLIEREQAIHDMLQDERAFEVRVEKCPSYETEREFDVKKAEYVDSGWIYPSEKMEIWLNNPESHESIETHYFSTTGLICLQ